MKLCKDCKHFVTVGMTSLLCQSSQTAAAQLVGISITRCEDERARPYSLDGSKGCGWPAHFFEPIEN